jgi:L-fuculose-phosphate aldolase
METDKLKKKVIEAGLLLVEKGLVTRSWGNISVRVDDRFMLITPSGRSYDQLRSDDLVKVDYYSGAYEGKIKPSSEYRLHAEVYRHRQEINAVIHTHQMSATTLAAARCELPPIIDDMVQIIGPSVRVTKYTWAGTAKFARQAVKAMHGRQAVLLANHGAVCVGRSLDEAFVVAEVLEKASRAFIEAKFLGGAKPIPNWRAGIMHQAFLKKYSKLEKKNR